MRHAKKTIQNHLKKKKIAIVHDAYLHVGGAEKVLEYILTLLPQADVFIPLIKQPYLQKLQKKYTVYTSAWNALPWLKKYSSFLKPLIFHHWEKLDLSKYDLVISSSHSFSSKSVKTKPDTVHISYIYTPPRYLYEQLNEMPWLKYPLVQSLLSPLLGYLRKKDFEGAKRPDTLIAISKTVQARIKKYYQRDSRVIYPPVFLPKKNKLRRTPQYYVFHSRLVAQKGAELVVRTFNKLKKPLVIIGTGPEEKRLKKMARANIVFRGFADDRNLAKIYRKAKALVYASVDEDFGMVPIEAMSYGVPVIAFSSGGVRETVIHKKTGLLFNNYSIESLENALRLFEHSAFLAQDCLEQAEKFSEARFRKEFLKAISL